MDEQSKKELQLSPDRVINILDRPFRLYKYKNILN